MSSRDVRIVCPRISHTGYLDSAQQAEPTRSRIYSDIETFFTLTLKLTIRFGIYTGGCNWVAFAKFHVFEVGQGWGNLRRGTCGWSRLLHTEIDVGTSSFGLTYTVSCMRTMFNQSRIR